MEKQIISLEETIKMIVTRQKEEGNSSEDIEIWEIMGRKLVLKWYTPKSAWSFPVESFEYRKAKQFFENKTANYLSVKKRYERKSSELTIQNWAWTVHKLLKEFTEPQVEAVLQFCITDPFWKNQVLSMDKLTKTKEWVKYIYKFVDMIHTEHKDNKILSI